MKRRRRRTRWIRVAAAVSFALAAASGFTYLSRSSARHARFFEQGQTLNSFLSQYSQAMLESHIRQEPTPLAPFYAADYSAAGGTWEFGPGDLVGGVQRQRLTAQGPSPLDRTSRLAERQRYLEELEGIETIRHKIHLIESVDDWRAVLTVKYVLDGVDPDGRTLQDRSFYRWTLRSSSEAGAPMGWQLAGEELIEGVRVSRDEPVFLPTEASVTGLDFAHRRDPKLDANQYADQLQFDVMEHGLGGISAADFDRDGRPDLFFADGVASRLYRNQTQVPGRPHFEDVTEEVGLAGLDQAAAGLFADFDNDGDQDLFVTRYLAANAYYRNDGGEFTEVAADLGLDLVDTSLSATLLDFDRDGWLDIYVALYGNAFEEIPRLPFFARNGRPNRLYRNQEGQGFVDVTESSGVGDTGWSMAVAAGDFDDDGWTDLAVANDFGRKNLYRNRGDGTFAEVSQQAGTLDFSGGMGVLFADLDSDGHLDLYTSNIKSNQRWFGEDLTIQQYLRNVLGTRWMLADFGEYRELQRLLGSRWPELGKEVGEGNSLFLNRGDGTFREAKDSHTNQAGWSWSVGAFDFDNDSDLDLYAANGWISNRKGSDL